MMISAGTFAQWLKSIPMIERGGWTLLHSIWELAGIAAILALVLRIFGEASPRIRYLAATIALALMLALPLFTFQIMDSGSPGAILPAASQFPAESPRGKPPETVPLPQSRARHLFSLLPAFLQRILGVSWSGRLSDRFGPAIPWLMLAWGVGVLALSLWNFGGWIATQRLRGLGVNPVGTELADRLSTLARRAGLMRPVRIAKSTLVQIPIVIGFIHPLILIPIYALAGLPPAHLEAILAHELAHIRRHDYLVNLFQVLVETLLFYHPAIWWVSRQIRIEREYCCDDIAAGICGDRRVYAEALISVEELRPPAKSLAVAATGGGGRMFARIHRLIGRPQRCRRHRSASLAAIILSLGLLIVPPAQEWISAQGVTSPDLGSQSSKIEIGLDKSARTDSRSGALPVALLGQRGDPNSALVAEFPFVVDFIPYGVSWGKFSSGDGITITSVRGDRKHIERGGKYLVEGTYALHSMERAVLGLSVTAPSRDSPGAFSSVSSEQRLEVVRGQGRFRLRETMRYPGSFHVSFTPMEGGESRGTIYFREGQEQAGSPGRPRATLHPFNVEISPDSFISARPPPRKFAESYTNAVEITPEKTNNFLPISDNIPRIEDAPSTKNSRPFSPPDIDPKLPQARQRLYRYAPSAIFFGDRFGTRNIIPTDIDSRWSSYGDYLQRMIETVQIEWDQMLRASTFYPGFPREVSVKFVMNAKGGVARIVRIEDKAGSSDPAARACVSAITSRAPYGDWTDDMVTVLGKAQEMTFKFCYQ